MNIAGPFIRRPVGTSLLATGLMAIGFFCYLLLGINALPQMAFPAIFVTASQPGADASTMASTVAAPLERHLGQIPGLDRMFSTSSEGGAFVFLLFRDGEDVDKAASKVQAAINAAQSDLPSGLTSPPSLRKFNPNNDPVLQLALTSETLSLPELFATADTLLKPQLAQLPDVASVDVAGSAQPSVRVDVDLHKLDSMGLTSNQLRNALRAASVTSPVGFLSNGQTRTTLGTNSQLASVEDFTDLIVAYQNGHPVYLHDVADVYAGAEDHYQAAYFNGQPSIGLDIFMRSEANIITTVERIKEALPDLQANLPPSVHLTPYYDGTPTIRASVNEVQITLLLSLAMVVLTMAFFLRRMAPTIIAATAVPLSLAGAFVLMYILGYTLNNMSLLALVIAISFVVDDAIVVIENIIRHLDAGKSRLEATLDGAREIGFTIVSITVSLMVVFIPLLFASGIVGMFFREFTVTLIAAIFVSAVVSLTLTPSLCGQFLHAAPPRQEPNWLDRFHQGMERWYKVTLGWTLRHPVWLALTPLLLIGMTYMLFGTVKRGFFPPQDTGLIWGRVSAGATLSFADMQARQESITRMLLEDPAVEFVGSQLGARRGNTSGSFSIQLKPLGQGREASTSEVLARLSQKAQTFSGVSLRLRAKQDLPSGGRGTDQGASHSLSLKGDSSQDLQEWLPRLQRALAQSELLRDVDTDMDRAGLQQNMVVDRKQAARLGISMADVDDALYNAFGQRQVATIYAGINEYQVVVTAKPEQAASPAALNRIHVRTDSGRMVPLSAIAHQESGLAPTSIRHENQYTTMDLSFNLAPGVALGDAMSEVHRIIDDARLPGSVRADLGDSFARFSEAQSSMPLLMLAAIIAVYIVLGMLYESLIHPITILSTLPSAGAGALLALVLFNMELSVVADMALILLIGLVKKNAIMMIDFALARQRAGLAAIDAIYEACLVRFRPIMMTTMVAILAALPLAIGMGIGAELRRPLGVAVIGGLIVSQALTLLSTPAIYLVFTRVGQRWRAWRLRRRASA